MKYSTGIIWKSKLRNPVSFLRFLIQRPLKTKLCSASEPEVSSYLLWTPASSCCFGLGQFVWVGFLVCYWFLHVLKPSWESCSPEWVSQYGATLHSSTQTSQRRCWNGRSLLPFLSAKLNRRWVLNAVLLDYKYLLRYSSQHSICSCHLWKRVIRGCCSCTPCQSITEVCTSQGKPTSSPPRLPSLSE